MPRWILKGPWCSQSPDLGGGHQIQAGVTPGRDPPPGLWGVICYCLEGGQEGRWVQKKKKIWKGSCQNVEYVFQTSGRNYCDFCFLSFELVTMLVLQSGGKSFILEK